MLRLATSALAVSSACGLATEPLKETAVKPNAGTLRVFVLAGQSNMEGQAEVESYNHSDPSQLLNGTLKYQLSDPRTAKQFAPCWDAQRNNWTVLDNIKVWYNECAETQGVNGSVIPGTAGVDATFGDFSVGYGVMGRYNNIGPEYGFGIGLNQLLNSTDDKVLIMKNAWGGKTLAGDFRPPRSASGWQSDPYCTDEATCSVVGHYYQVMMANVAKLMAPGVIGQMFPDLAGLTPQLSGFGWWQGWNDGCDLNMTAAYEANMVNLIQDLREAWKEPLLPVVIAAAGFDGYTGEEATRQPPNCWSTGNKINCNCDGDRGCRRLDVVLSQIAASNLTLHPDLKGNVGYVETRGFWREAQYSPNQGQGYHYWHNAETYFLTGHGMAQSMADML